MLKQPTYKSIFKLAIPALFGGIVEPVLSLTDLAVVGNIDGQGLGNEGQLSAVAAVGIAGSLVSALLWIFAQVKSAVSAIVSKKYGENQLEEVATLIPQMIFFNLSIGVVAFLVTFFTSHWIFSEVLSAKGDILTHATSYYNIRAIGFPITLVTFSLFGVFRGLQNTLWAMVISVVGGLLNILLDFILVLGLGNIVEPMGVEGAALASVIAQIVMFLLAIYFLLRAKLKLKLSAKFNAHFKPMMVMAANLMVRTVTLNVALILSHKYANKYGEAEAGTHAVMLNLWLFSAFFLDAFATSANAMAGKFIGQKNKLAYILNLKRNLMLSILVSIGLVGTLLCFHESIIGLLVKDKVVLDYYVIILPLFAVCLPLNALAFTLDGIFKGSGEARFLRNLLLIATLIGYLPILLIGNQVNPGLTTIWLAIVVWIALRGIIPLFYFRIFVKRVG